MNLDNSQIWKVWSKINPIEGITSHTGYLDNSPLFDKLYGIYQEK